MAGRTAPIPRNRVDAYAELLSQGMIQKDIAITLGLTKGEGVNCFRVIRRELGSQAA